MKLSELIFYGEYISSYSADEIDVKDVVTSPQKIREDSLLVILKSIKRDINNILISAVKPCAIICERDAVPYINSIPIFVTDSVRKILPFIYSRFYKIDFSKMLFCGITGTNGKTSTATILSRILSYSGRKVGFIGTGRITIGEETLTDNNYSMTTPDPDLLYSSIKRMEVSGCDAVVMEVSSHALHFYKTLAIPYEICIFTNLSPEHMDFHSDMEDYYSCKMRLFKQTRLGIFNLDDSYSRRAYNEMSSRKTSVGIVNTAEYMARRISSDGLYKIEFVFSHETLSFKVRLSFGGDYNIYNSMHAIVGALYLGVDPILIQESLHKMPGVDGRLEIIEDAVTVIVDYAHTPRALENVLKTINTAKNSGQNLITVFGCGGERDRAKRPDMAHIAEIYSDRVIVTTDNSRGESELDIIRDILEGFSNTDKRIVIASREAAIEHAILSAREKDLIAIIGKGHEQYNIDKNGYHPFNEKDIILRALKKRKGIRENDNNTGNFTDA